MREGCEGAECRLRCGAEGRASGRRRGKEIGTATSGIKFVTVYILRCTAECVSFTVTVANFFFINP